jgi:hypothetical protein
MRKIYSLFITLVCSRVLAPGLRQLLFVALLLGSHLLLGQQADSVQAVPVSNIQLDNIDVAPAAVDTKGWLMLNADIRLELEGAVHNLYNLKFEKAEKQFRSLRRRYPQHPMPYFLMGMSQWWKMLPGNLQIKQFDPAFFAYMDTAVTKAEVLYQQDDKNYEACFFLSAAYGFDARLSAERHNWRKATVSSKRALDYLEKCQEANGLSPEFLFGQGLMNYYAIWISERYPLLRPVLWFFPKGNRQKGLQQLQSVADNGFYTAPEAKYFLSRILYYEEKNPKAAMALAKSMAEEYPDNSYFQRFYAMNCFTQGSYKECERVSREMEEKINKGMPGYEAVTGRYATYFLGRLMESKYRNMPKAQEYYRRCIAFAESTGDTHTGYYLHANWNLARIAAQAEDISAAARYYTIVRERAEPQSEMSMEAEAFLKEKRGKRRQSAGGISPQQAATLVSRN